MEWLLSTWLGGAPRWEEWAEGWRTRRSEEAGKGGDVKDGWDVKTSRDV